MKVKELIELLSEHDPEMEVLFEQYSGYTRLEKTQVREEVCVDHDHYVEKFWPHQYKNEEMPEITKFLCFPGN